MQAVSASSPMCRTPSRRSTPSTRRSSSARTIRWRRAAPRSRRCTCTARHASKSSRTSMRSRSAAGPLGLSAGLHHTGEIARRPQGQARARHRRQRRNVQAGRHGPGGRHAGRGGRPASARRYRLPARHRGLAAHLRLRRRCEIRHRFSARPVRAGARHVPQSRHLEQVHARAEEVHLKQAAWISAKMAIGNFIIANEAALNTMVKDKGVQMVKVGDAFDPMRRIQEDGARHQCRDREGLRASRTRRRSSMLTSRRSNGGARFRRGRPRHRQVHRRADKEIFSKVDPEKL